MRSREPVRAGSKRSALPLERPDGAASAPHSVPEGFPWPIVLGIDPGTRLVGYGALVSAPDRPRLLAAGGIRTPRNASVPARLAAIRRELDDLLARLKPTVVVVEQAYAARNVQSALRIGEGRGVVLACACGFGAEVVQFPPASARKTLLGNGSAGKAQVARMVATVLGLAEPPEPLDLTDALALALAYVQRRGHGTPLPEAAARRRRSNPRSLESSR